MLQMPPGIPADGSDDDQVRELDALIRRRFAAGAVPAAPPVPRPAPGAPHSPGSGGHQAARLQARNPGWTCTYAGGTFRAARPRMDPLDDPDPVGLEGRMRALDAVLGRGPESDP